MAEIAAYNLFAIDGKIVLLSLCGGILPALFWLWFWLREDAAHPEPRWLIVFSFVMGMLFSAIAIPLEAIAQSLLAKGFFLLLVGAAIEEIVKYSTAQFSAFRNRNYDEPIDALIYMITVALGFAAAENTLYLASVIFDKGHGMGFLVGNIRFIGSTLLHVVSSAVTGGALALGFYKEQKIKKYYLIIGLVLSTLMHALFNSYIMSNNSTAPEDVLFDLLFGANFLVWIGAILLILFFEKVKTLNKEPYEVSQQ